MDRDSNRPDIVAWQFGGAAVGARSSFARSLRDRIHGRIE
jgi:hypothetical protein